MNVKIMNAVKAKETEITDLEAEIRTFQREVNKYESKIREFKNRLSICPEESVYIELFDFCNKQIDSRYVDIGKIRNDITFLTTR
jgi:predicted RNase H-like nuclease (RuvC/YqgF family)